MHLQPGRTFMQHTPSGTRTSIKAPKDAQIQKLEAALFSDPKNVALHNQLADYALGIRNYDKAYQHYQCSHREDSTQTEVILKMAITKYESAMDPNLTSHGHSRSDPGVMSLSQASVHLREYQTRIEEANSRERKAKRSNLSAAAAAFEISTFLAQHNRDLCRDLSVNIEGPVLPFFVHDSTNPTFEARLQAAISSGYGASFVLHHRLLSYYLYSARFADIITHIESYNRIEYGLMTNIEWTRWCERFCSGLVERHFECRLESYSADLTDDMRRKYVALEDVNIFDLLILRLRLMGQRNSLETEFSTISEFSELCESHAHAIESTQGHMEELFKDSYYSKREEEWTQWKTEMQQTNSSQKWRAFLRLSAVAADPSALVQQAWDWLVQSFDHADFMHVERWSLDSNFDSAPHFAEFSSPTQLARLTRFSEDCKFAHLLLSSTTASGKNKEASKKYAKFVLAVPPPSNLSANFFLSVAIKCDMILLARAREVREWSWVQNKLFFYFEFSRQHAVPMILDFLIHMCAPESRTMPIMADLIAFITLQKTDDKRAVLPWSSPLLPWVELIKQPFFDVSPISNSNDQRTWVSLLGAIADGTSPHLSSDLEASVDGSVPASASNGLLSTPARKTRTSILTPSRLGTPGGARNFLTPQRPRVGLSQPATPVASENKASKVALNVQGSTLSIDRNSFFAKRIKRSELKILGALAAHDPTTISDVSGTTNTLLSLLEWAASRYDVARKSGLKLAPSSIASHVVAALNVDTFFVAVSLPSVSESEQSSLESASILVIDSLLQSVPVEQLPTPLYETLLKHSSTMQDNANAALLSAELWNLIATREGEDSSAHKHLMSNLERAEKLLESGRSQTSRVIFADFESRIARLRSSAPSHLATPSSSKASSNISSLQTPGKVPTKSLFAQPAVVEPEPVKSHLSEEQLQQAFVSRLKRGLAKVTITQQTPIQIDDFDLDYLRPFSPSTSSPAVTLASLVPSNISTPSTPADHKRKPEPTFSSISTPKSVTQDAPASSPFVASKATSNFGASAEPVEEKPVATPSFSNPTSTFSPAPTTPSPATPVVATMTEADKDAIKRQMRAEMEAEIAKEKALLQAQREDFERERKLFQLSKDSAKKEQEKKRSEYQQMLEDHHNKIAAEAEEMERRRLAPYSDDDSDDDDEDHHDASDDEEDESSSTDDSFEEKPSNHKVAAPIVSAKPEEPPRRTSPRAHPLVPKMVFNTGKTHSFGTKTSPTGSAQTSPTTPTSANSLSMQAVTSAHSNDSSPSSIDSATSASSASNKSWTPLPKGAYSFGSKTTASAQSPAFLGRTAGNGGKDEERVVEQQRERSASLPKSSFGFGGSFGTKNSFGFSGSKPLASVTEELKPVAATSTPPATTIVATPSTPSSVAAPSSSVPAPTVVETKVEPEAKEDTKPTTAEKSEPADSKSKIPFTGFSAITPAPAKTSWNTSPTAAKPTTSFGFTAKPTTASASDAVSTPSSSTSSSPASDASPSTSPASVSPPTPAKDELVETKEAEKKEAESATPARPMFGGGFGAFNALPKTSFGAKPAASTPASASASTSSDPQKPQGMSDAEWAEVRPKPVNAATSAFMSGASKPAPTAAAEEEKKEVVVPSAEDTKPAAAPARTTFGGGFGKFSPFGVKPSTAAPATASASNSSDPQKPQGMSDAEWAEVRPKPVNAATSAFMSGASKPAPAAAKEESDETEKRESDSAPAAAVEETKPVTAPAPTTTFGFGASAPKPTTTFGFTPTASTAKSNASTVGGGFGSGKFNAPKFGASKPTFGAPAASTASNTSDPQKPEGMSDAEWAEVRPKPVNAATSAFMSGASKPASSTPASASNSSSSDPQKPQGMSDAEWAEVRPKPVNAATSAFMSGASKPAPAAAKEESNDVKEEEKKEEETAPAAAVEETKPIAKAFETSSFSSAPATTFGFGKPSFGFPAKSSFGAKLPETGDTFAATDVDQQNDSGSSPSWSPTSSPQTTTPTSNAEQETQSSSTGTDSAAPSTDADKASDEKKPEEEPAASESKPKPAFGSFGKPSFGSGSTFGTPKLSFGAAKPTAFGSPFASSTASTIAAAPTTTSTETSSNDSSTSPAAPTEEKPTAAESKVAASVEPKETPDATPASVEAPEAKDDEVKEQKEETTPSSVEEKEEVKADAPTDTAVPASDSKDAPTDVSDKKEEIDAATEETKDEKDVSTAPIGFSPAAQAAKTTFSLTPSSDQAKTTFAWNAPATTATPTKSGFGSFSGFGAKPTATATATATSPTSSTIATTPQFATVPGTKTFGFGFGASFAKAAAAASTPSTPAKDAATTPASTPASETPSPVKPAFSLGSGFAKSSNFGFKAPAASSAATSTAPTTTSTSSTDNSTSSTTTTTDATHKEEEDVQKVTEVSEAEPSNPAASKPAAAPSAPKEQKIEWREPSLEDDDDEDWAKDSDEEEEKPASTAAPQAKNSLNALLKAPIGEEDDIMTDDEENNTDEDADDEDDVPPSPAGPESALAAGGVFSDDEEDDDDFGLEDESSPSKSTTKPSNSWKSALAAGGLSDSDDDDDFIMEDDDTAPKSNAPQAALSSMGGFDDVNDDFDVVSDSESN